jgi:hypothetical protein
VVGGAAQDAQARPVHRPEDQPVVLVGDVVVAVAEEHEVVVLEPGQERLGLVDVGRVDRELRRVQLGGYLERLRSHLRPVLDGGADLADDAQQVAPECVQLRSIGLPRHLGVDHGLGDRVVRRGGVGRQDVDQGAGVVAADVHDRVDDQVDAEAAPVQLHRHRIDQERHVVGDDLHRRVRRLPAVLLELRVVDAQLRLAGRARACEVEVGQRSAVEVDRGALGQVLGGHPAVVLPRERLGLRGVSVVKLLVQPRTDAVD